MDVENDVVGQNIPQIYRLMRHRNRNGPAIPGVGKAFRRRPRSALQNGMTLNAPRAG